MHDIPEVWWHRAEPPLRQRLRVISRWWLGCLLDAGRWPHVPMWALAYLMFIPGTVRAATRQMRHRMHLMHENMMLDIEELEKQRPAVQCGPHCILEECAESGRCSIDETAELMAKATRAVNR